MIGQNKLILNHETMMAIIETHLKNHFFKELDFTVTDVDYRLYKWELTLAGKEVTDERHTEI